VEVPIELWLAIPDAEMCRAFEAAFDGLPRVRILEQRYEELAPHDCFVTAGNSFGMMTAGIDATVVHVHGQQLMRRVQQRILDDYLGEQPIGTAFIEPTGSSEQPWLAHAPTMRVPGGIDGTDRVYAATWGAFIAIDAHNRANDPIRTVAMPAMGTGFGGVPAGEAARQMAAAYRHYLDPPTTLDWDVVTARHVAIVYDGDRRVIH
jgi:O-acetyl-ADP-ribose deacetylase (regulator of RNase III)